MSEIIRFVRAILNLLGNLGQPIGVLLQPLLTVAMPLSCTPAGTSAMRAACWRVCVWHSWTPGIPGRSPARTESAILERELHQSGSPTS